MEPTIPTTIRLLRSSVRSSPARVTSHTLGAMRRARSRAISAANGKTSILVARSARATSTLRSTTPGTAIVRMNSATRMRWRAGWPSSVVSHVYPSHKRSLNDLQVKPSVKSIHPRSVEATWTALSTTLCTSCESPPGRHLKLADDEVAVMAHLTLLLQLVQPRPSPARCRQELGVSTRLTRLRLVRLVKTRSLSPVLPAPPPRSRVYLPQQPRLPRLKRLRSRSSIS